jgi:hypothetical protein
MITEEELKTLTPAERRLVEFFARLKPPYRYEDSYFAKKRAAPEAQS